MSRDILIHCHSHPIPHHYPFGSIVENRSWKGDYRYGFNGQERDDEVSGAGNSYTAEYWQYDSRLGRRWNVDPVPQVSMSDYSVNGNNPNVFVDPLGAFKTKFGAWIYSKTHGGGDVQKYHDDQNVQGDLGEKALKSGHKYYVSGKGSKGSVSSTDGSLNTDGSYDLNELSTNKGKPIIDWGGNTYSEKARQEAIDDYKIDFQIRQAFPQHTYPEIYKSNGQGAWWYDNAYERNMAWARNATILILPSFGIKTMATNQQLPRLKVLTNSNTGQFQGWSISSGINRYGARPRIDYHVLTMPSKKSNSLTMPNILHGKRLPHYHRGKGNNLRRHRPWEKGWDDKSFMDRF